MNRIEFFAPRFRFFSFSHIISSNLILVWCEGVFERPQDHFLCDVSIFLDCGYDFKFIAICVKVNKIFKLLVIGTSNWVRSCYCYIYVCFSWYIFRCNIPLRNPWIHKWTIRLCLHFVTLSKKTQMKTIKAFTSELLFAIPERELPFDGW